MYERNRPRVTRQPLPPGDAGTFKTLELMRRLATEGSKVLEVRETAISVVRSAGVAPHDVRGQAAALFRFVRDGVYFVGDIVGTQVLQSAAYTLRTRAGNCAQRSILLAALLRSIGIPATFRAIGANPNFPGVFSHVYVAVKLGAQSLALDPTYANNALGWQYPKPSRFAEVSA